MLQVQKNMKHDFDSHIKAFRKFVLEMNKH